MLLENNFKKMTPNNTLYRASPFVNVGRGYSNGLINNKPISWFSTSENNARVYIPIQSHLSKTILPVVRKYNITKNNGIMLLRLDNPSVINKLKDGGVNLSRSFVVKNNKVLRVKRSKQLESNLASAQQLGNFMKRHKIPASGWYHNSLQIAGRPTNRQNAELALFNPNEFVRAKTIDPPSGAIYRWNGNQPRSNKNINNNNNNNNNRNRSSRPSPVKRRRTGKLFDYPNRTNNNIASGNGGSHSFFGGIPPRIANAKDRT